MRIDQAFGIEIGDVNEAPSLDATVSAVREHQAAGALAATLAATDPDAGQSLGYSLFDQPGTCTSADRSAFTLDGNRLLSTQELNYETQNSYTVCVHVSDDGAPALGDDLVIAIPITDINEAPTGMALSSTGVAENQAAGTTVGSLSASDPDTGQTHIFTLLDPALAQPSGVCSGAEGNASFTISGNVLQTNQAFNYESQSSYTICIRTTDNGSPVISLDQPFTINVSDVNEAPTGISLTPSSIAENQDAGTVIGALSASDPDDGQSLSFSLIDPTTAAPSGTCDGANDNAAFTVAGNNLLAAQSFDHESQDSHIICVRATDNGDPAASSDRKLTVSVADVNEAPTEVRLTSSSVAENLPVGTKVSGLTAVDPDAGQTHSFALSNLGETCSGVDNGAFSISGSDLLTNQVFNYEVKGGYTICIRTTDSGAPALDFYQPVNIAVSNVNEPPILVTPLIDQITDAGVLFQYAFSADAFDDPDREPLTYQAALQDGSPLPAWLRFDPDKRSFSGTPMLPQELDVSAAAKDALGESASDTFHLSVRMQAGNHPPVLVYPIPNASAQVDEGFRFSFSDDHFADYDGDPLHYGATLSDGSPLPDWLGFDPATPTFSGTPGSSDIGALSIEVTVLDGRGGTASTLLTISVGQNAPPSLLLSIPDQTAGLGLPWSFQLDPGTFADPNGDPLTYFADQADGAPLPAWLSFDPATGTFAGTSPVDGALLWDLRVTASDPGGGSAQAVFRLSPWSFADTGGLPAGVVVAFNDRAGAGPLTNPPKAARLNRTAGLNAGYAGLPASELDGAGMQVCFQAGLEERLAARGDLSRLRIGMEQEDAWVLLPTQAKRGQLCAQGALAGLYDIFRLPGTDPSGDAAGDLPKTGFAPGQSTRLQPQPAERTYADLGSVWLEIPALDLKTTVLGVPLEEGSWDVSWLGGRIGWLEGSAFPGLAGNSALTGHLNDSNGLAGPFQRLRELSWGQQVIVHAFGVAYTYEARTVDTYVSPNDRKSLRHEELPWLTLVTCQGYDPASASYRWRTVVRAVLVKTTGESIYSSP